MLERLFYIEYEARMKNEKYYNAGSFHVSFVVGKLFLFLLPSLFLLHKLYEHGILNWYKYFDYSGTIRLSVIFTAFFILYAYCFFNLFRDKKRIIILQKYRGKYKTLIKYSLVFVFSTMCAIPLILILLIELFFKLL